MKPYLKFGSRIHATFNIHGTVTGRLSCLVGDTRIAVADERVQVPIRDIHEGDLVWSYDENLKPTHKRVTWQGKTGEADELVEVTYQPVNSYITSTIICTPEHKFRLHTGEYREAQSLRSDDMVVMHFNSRATIESVQHISCDDGPVDVYDITVEETHNFVANMICVHNSSSPNLQNLPKRGKLAKIVRKVIKPSSGRVLMSLDYSQAELRSLAVLSGDPKLIDIFVGGGDMHDSVATDMFGEDFTKDQRTACKKINFGIIYGATAPKVAEQLVSDGVHLTIAEAQDYMDRWAQSFSRAWEFIQDTRDLTKFAETLITVFGRKRRFHVIYSGNWHSLENKAGNFLHQSMCSDFTLEACIRQDRELANNPAEYPGNPLQVNIVHDDNLFEVDRTVEALLPLASMVKRTMEQVPIDMGITQVPFIADAEIGLDWGHLETLNMEALKQGRIETHD